MQVIHAYWKRKKRKGEGRLMKNLSPVPQCNITNACK